MVLHIAGQALALEPSQKELKKFLMILDLQCKNYGWMDAKLEGIPWEYYRVSGQKNPLIFTVLVIIKTTAFYFWWSPWRRIAHNLCPAEIRQLY